MAWILISLLAILIPSAFAQTVQTKPFAAALGEVINSPEYQSNLSNIQSIELDFDSREIVLEPILQLQGTRTNDNRELFSTIPGQARQQRPRVDTLSMTLSKPFSTGTLVSVTPQWVHALTPTTTPDERYYGEWSVAISQSLWKDFFGRSTRLRRARESFERKQQLADALSKRGQVLVDFESLYWDWALVLRQKELQEKNLKRSRDILKWTQDRFNRSAAESTDLLQAKALLTQRELQLSVLNLSVTQALTKLQRYLPNGNWQPDPNDLMIARKPESLTQEWKADALGDVQQLSFISAQNEALAETEKAKEAREAIRPELTLNLIYGKNAIDETSSAAVRRSTGESHDYSTVGVVFRTGLDLSSERKKVDSARAAKDSANQRREARGNENKIAWAQLKKELQDLEQQAKSAHELVDLQIKKANAERDRYRKGRTTAFAAITFEQDANEAEITLWTLYAYLRKTEARARLFAR